MATHFLKEREISLFANLIETRAKKNLTIGISTTFYIIWFQIMILLKDKHVESNIYDELGDTSDVLHHLISYNFMMKGIRGAPLLYL